MIQKHQRTLTLDDVDAIVSLDEIAGRIERGVRALTEKDWFSVSGHFFKKPTFARTQLIQRINEAFGEGPFSVAGVLYALDMDRKPDELDSVPSRFRLIKYIATLDVPIKKAVEVLNEIFGDDDGEPDAKPVDHWEVCAILSREVGGSPDEWMDATGQKISSAMKSIEDKYDAEARAMGVAKGPPRETPKLLAIVEFRDKLNALEASWVG